MRSEESRTLDLLRAVRARRGLAAFLALAYGLSYAAQLAIWSRGGLDGPLFARVAPWIMFAPALAAWVACRMEGIAFRELLRSRFAPAALAAAVLIPAATATTTAFLLGAWLGGSPLPWAWEAGVFVVPEAGPFLWSGAQGPIRMAGNWALTTLGLSLLAGLLAVGEEIGWRGYLQPRLCRRLGTVPGLTAVGLLWAFWHLPVLLMGYVFPEAPVLGGLVLFPLIGIALSYFLGILRETSDGIWAPVLAHGSYNAFFGALVLGMDVGGRDLASYLVVTAVTGLTGVACLPLLRRG